MQISASTISQIEKRIIKRLKLEGLSQEESEDYLQEGWKRLYSSSFLKSHPNFNFSDSRAIVRLLWTIITNLRINAYYRNKIIQCVSLTEEVFSANAPFEEKIIDTIFIEQVLQSLSPDDCNILKMVMKGYEVERIATELGITKSTAYQRIERAYARARDHGEKMSYS